MYLKRQLDEIQSSVIGTYVISSWGATTSGSFEMGRVRWRRSGYVRSAGVGATWAECS